MVENFRCRLKLPGASSASQPVGERLFSSQTYTIADARSRLLPKTNEAIELIRWAVRGSLFNKDD